MSNSSVDPGVTAPPPSLWARWNRITPGHYLAVLLAVQLFLFCSEKFLWFEFNRHKGWTVLITLAITSCVLVILLTRFVTNRFSDRKMQFSIGAMFLMMPCLAIPLAWMTASVKQAMEQRKIVVKVESGWGSAGYSKRHWSVYDQPPKGRLVDLLGRDFFEDVDSVSLRSDQGPDEIVRLPYLRSVNLSRCIVPVTPILHALDRAPQVKTLMLKHVVINNEDWEALQELKHLQVLLFDGAIVTDTGLAHLKDLSELEQLSLNQTAVTDVGLAHFSKNSGLKILWLNQTKISDEGLNVLKEFPDLEQLWLRGTDVTDDGLASLAPLKKLGWVDLRETSVTKEGIVRIKKSLPNTQFQITGTAKNPGGGSNERETDRSVP
jgi:hypothetical protein